MSFHMQSSRSTATPTGVLNMRRINPLECRPYIGANQPGWSAGARNGKRGLTFNGSTQSLRTLASLVSKTRRRVSRARRLTAGYSHSALLSDIAHAAFWISDRACSSRIQRQQRRERRQQNQINNFHGRCPQLDGRWVVQHKPVTELLDAEKVLKAVEFCAPPRVPRQMIISGNSRGLALMHAGCQIHLSRPESPARNQLAYFPARLCRNLGKR